MWATHSSEDTDDVDEPPENRNRSPERFRRAPIRRPSEQTSLLTKAIMGVPEQEEERSALFDYKRRRSMASNLSIASTADLTSDTGLTSPARTNTPSPPLPEMTFARFNTVTSRPKSPGLDRPIQLHSSVENATHLARKPSADVAPKRCIQFACAGGPPKQQAPAVQPVQPVAEQHSEAPRRPCIKFACADGPSTTQSTPPRAPTMRRAKSPATPKSNRPTPAATSPSTPRQTTPRRLGDKARARPKYLRANSVDLTSDGSQFHEFASEVNREADWIRRDSTVVKSKLTINDTLTKENHIRRIATEAEEEAELEEQEAQAASDEDDDEVDDEEDEDEDGEDDDDEDEMDEEDEVDDEEEEEYGLSDGYYTDEETGFASSDESEGEEDGNMVLWTLSKSPTLRQEPVLPIIHDHSFHDVPSDSSITTSNHRRRSNMQRVKPSEMAELPDSTDFVCGTLDEDRPLEERYISSLAARRKDKLRVIPQDIDPSFPASDPEDEDGEDFYNPVHHDSDDDDYPLPGEMEDLHHEQDRSRRRRKSEHASPRKYHSPPPKRHQSPPPPRARGRSPKNLFDRRSPRRMRSPAPKAVITPLGSPKLGNHVAFNLAARPGPMTTKSLPRAGGMFHKQRRLPKSDYEDDIHVRGAIDIVKGLEKKRQRRREKFYQKYCNRARRGQIPERKPQPGRGAERMKELGLLMAGKKDQGNYVLSI